MSEIAYFKQILKDEFFERVELFNQFLCTEDISEIVSAAHYLWRDRIWTPIQTLWTFLIQVLNAGCSCRQAVAYTLAELAVSGKQALASPDPSAYCQGRTRLPLSLFKSAVQYIGQRLEETVTGIHSITIHTAYSLPSSILCSNA